MKKKYFNFLFQANPLKVASGFSILLAIVKLVTFVLTGSLVLLSSFLDSVQDALISFINTKIQKISKEKPDKKHPFGHGGIEVLSGLIQGSIILAFGLTIAFGAIDRMLNSTSSLKEDNLLLGFIVLIVGAACGFLLNIYLTICEKHQRAQNDTNISICTDRAHYEGDFWFNLISAVGMGLVWISGLNIIDSICALIASGFFIKATFPVFIRTYKDIINEEVEPKLQEQIKNLIYTSDPKIQDIHDLRSRLLGPTIFIDCHICLPKDLSVLEASAVVSKVQQILYEKLNIDALIHVDAI